MQAHLASGLSAAEAARAVLGEDSEGRGRNLGGPPSLTAPCRPRVSCPVPSGGPLTPRRAAAQAVLDRLVSDLSVTTVLRDVRCCRYLTELGERWEREQPASPRSTSPRPHPRGGSPGSPRPGRRARPPRRPRLPPRRAPRPRPDDLRHHVDRNGSRIDYLGMSTPVGELTRTVDARRPDLVVLAATLPENLEPLAAQPPRSPSTLRSPSQELRCHAGTRGRRGSPAADRRPGYRGRDVDGRSKGLRAAAPASRAAAVPGTGRTGDDVAGDDTPPRLLRRRRYAHPR